MVREPNKPRGKLSAYGFFVKMCYDDHKKSYPAAPMQVTELSKICAEKWKALPEANRQRFYTLALEDAERYKAEIAAYGGEDVVRKHKRAQKDPNSPKRALSGFFFFSRDKRSEVQQAHPEWKIGQVAQELGRQWKVISADMKQQYEQMAAQDKVRYQQELVEYKATGQMPPSRRASVVVNGISMPLESQEFHNGEQSAGPTRHDSFVVAEPAMPLTSEEFHNGEQSDGPSCHDSVVAADLSMPPDLEVFLGGEKSDGSSLNDSFVAAEASSESAQEFHHEKKSDA